MSPLKIGGGSELEVNGGVRISFTVVAIVRFVCSGAYCGVWFG